MDGVPECWCPLPRLAVDAVLFIRRDICDGALGDDEAVIPICADLARCIRPVPPDGCWREGVFL
jgi:hypothetical protein